MSKHETTLQPDPVCPHCGHKHRDAWEWNFGPGLDGGGDRECESCGETFRCDRIVDVSYTTRQERAAMQGSK